jgi:hypothetical protein
VRVPSDVLSGSGLSLAGAYIAGRPSHAGGLCCDARAELAGQESVGASGQGSSLQPAGWVCAW